MKEGGKRRPNYAPAASLPRELVLRAAARRSTAIHAFYGGVVRAGFGLCIFGLGAPSTLVMPSLQYRRRAAADRAQAQSFLVELPAYALTVHTVLPKLLCCIFFPDNNSDTSCASSLSLVHTIINACRCQFSPFIVHSKLATAPSVSGLPLEENSRLPRPVSSSPSPRTKASTK